MNMKVNQLDEEQILPQKVFTHRKEDKARKIVEVLKKDCRASLPRISKRTGIPVSTVFKVMQTIREHNDFKLVLNRRKCVKGSKNRALKGEKILA